MTWRPHAEEAVKALAARVAVLADSFSPGDALGILLNFGVMDRAREVAEPLLRRLANADDESFQRSSIHRFKDIPKAVSSLTRYVSQLNNTEEKVAAEVLNRLKRVGWYSGNGSSGIISEGRV